MHTRFILLSSLTALVLGLAGGILSGCSVLVDVDGKQCESDSDCAPFQDRAAAVVCRQNLCVDAGEPGDGGAGGAGIDPLSCEPPEAATTPTVKYSFAPIFAQEPDEPKPFSIKACAQLDLECEHPLFGPLDVNAGEPQDFEVPPGFNGYFQIENPDTLGGLLFMGRPVVADTVGWNVTMPTPAVVMQLAFATGKMVDPELGIILSVARDCNAVALEGVTYTNSVMSTPDLLSYYFVNSLPDTGLTKTGPQGAAGYANVPIGTAVLTGTSESGKALGPVSLRMKPHWISFGELFP
jgi:hypothetical protein